MQQKRLVASDLDNDPLTFSWQQLSGPSVALTTRFASLACGRTVQSIT